MPGDRPEWVQKAARSGADAVILDLEDAVAADRKDAARAAVAELVHGPDPGLQVWVRVEPSTLALDVEAAVGPLLAGIVLPKISLDAVGECDTLLVSLSSSAPVLGLLETAAGLLEVVAVAAHPRVRRLGLGEADLAADLGLVPDDDRTQLAPVRSSVVVASAAAGIDRPVGPVHTALDDEAGLRRTTSAQLRQGFRGRTAINPRQVAVINELLTPTADELDAARVVVAAYERSLAGGVGASRDADGRIMDAATVRSAREVLGRAPR